MKMLFGAPKKQTKKEVPFWGLLLLQTGARCGGQAAIG
jgi:hypothetical protein